MLTDVAMASPANRTLRKLWETEGEFVKGTERKGHDEKLKAGRAVPNRPRGDLDDEPAMMVQEQIARVKFLDRDVYVGGKKVLNLGCGTGFDCEYLKAKLGARDVLGVDISHSAIAFAKENYPGTNYIQGDICSESLRLGENAWDIVVCAEVIEHVPNPAALLDTIYRHLNENGVALISTPNRPVFSLDHEPSPVNHTHLKEYNLTEYRRMLEGRFSKVDIWGQRFTDDRLFRMQQSIVARNIRDLKILGGLYWNTNLRQLWKMLRMEPVIRLLGGGLKYSHKDFEFVNPVTSDSIWLCALATK